MRINQFITLLIMVFWANHAMGAPPVLRGVVFQSDEGEGPLAGIVLETDEGTRVTTNEDGGFAIRSSSHPAIPPSRAAIPDQDGRNG